jgi:hypothetical protein
LLLGEGPAPAPPARRRRRAFLAAAALALALVAAAAGWAWLRPVAPPAPGPTPAAPLTAALEVRVWKKDDLTRGQTLEAAGVLPLRAGDHVRFEAAVPRSAYLYLIYLDAKGEASPLFPWRGYDWADRPEEGTRRRLRVPDGPGKDAAPLGAGPSGIETVLLIAREAPLSADENGRLAKALAGRPQAGRFDPLRGAVWLTSEEDHFAAEADRSRPRLDQAGKVLDPVERARRLVRSELAGLGAVRGVCYPFAGE